MKLKRRWRWLIFVLSLYAVICAVGGIYLADGTVHPGRRTLDPQDVANFQAVVNQDGATLAEATITTTDGVILKGWMLRPAHANGDAVMLLHGLGDNRLGMTGYARLLLAHGYVVLLPDAREHGESGGTLATFGLLERNDIHQWVDYVESATHPGCVYGLGESMGAAQLLQSLELEKRLCGVVAESSFSTFQEIAYDRMGQPFGLGPWVGRFALRPMIEIAFLRVRWKFGLDMRKISPEAAVEHSSTPVLLIHGQIDGNIPVRHGRAMHEECPRTVLWEVPGADHCGAIAAAPAEFERRVLGWFARAKVQVTQGPLDCARRLTPFANALRSG